MFRNQAPAAPKPDPTAAAGTCPDSLVSDLPRCPPPRMPTDWLIATSCNPRRCWEGWRQWHCSGGGDSGGGTGSGARAHLPRLCRHGPAAGWQARSQPDPAGGGTASETDRARCHPGGLRRGRAFLGLIPQARRFHRLGEGRDVCEHGEPAAGQADEGEGVCFGQGGWEVVHALEGWESMIISR